MIQSSDDGFSPPNRELCSLSQADSLPKLEGLTLGPREKGEKKTQFENMQDGTST